MGSGEEGGSGDGPNDKGDSCVRDMVVAWRMG